MVFSLFSNKKVKELKSKREQLYRVAYSWCNDELLADDLVNEALIKAMKNGSQLRDKSTVNSWLFKILSNCWHDHLRKIKPEDNIDDIVFIDNETPEQLLQQQEIILQVKRAIALLPMGQRQVITLVDIEGFSYGEVALILDVAVGTVMSRLNRGRTLLKEKLMHKQRNTIEANISFEHKPDDNDVTYSKLRSVK